MANGTRSPRWTALSSEACQRMAVMLWLTGMALAAVLALLAETHRCSCDPLDPPAEDRPASREPDAALLRSYRIVQADEIVADMNRDLTAQLLMVTPAPLYAVADSHEIEAASSSPLRVTPAIEDARLDCEVARRDTHYR